MYITKYSCVFLKLGESIYMAMDVIPILLGSLPLAHNAQHSLVLLILVASVPGLPRSVRVLIMRRRQTFENRFSNVFRLRIIKTRTERGRPGTEASILALSI